MKRYLLYFFLSFFMILESTGTQIDAEPSPTEILKKATKLTCTFTFEHQTRWGSTGPLNDEGPINEQVTFDSINHQTGEAKILIKKQYIWQDDDPRIPIRIRDLAHSITFFELTKSGKIDPVITTVLDDYYSETSEFIAVSSAHVTSAFGRQLAIQQIGTCVPGK